jgi:predicted nuclease of predicted toxin-antitoxin system
VKFLIDESLSRSVAARLSDAGHDAVHIGDLGLLGTDDETVMATALDQDRVQVTADTDFGALLALSGAPGPSVILFRRGGRRPTDQAALLIANIEAFREPIDDHFIAVIGTDRIRIRPLPINAD